MGWDSAKRWLKPAALAALIGLVSLSGKMDAMSDAASALADKDLLIRWTSAWAGATREATPVTLIDIDAETMDLFGNPDRAPRRLVADLLDLAQAKRPLGVFLDIDLSKPDMDGAADDRLRAAFAAWTDDAPMLAVARRFQKDKAREDDDAAMLRPLPLIVADAIANRPNIRQAASVALADSDSVVRRWRLSQAVCDAGARQAFASPQLLATAAASGRSLADVDRFLDWRLRDVCAKDAKERPAWPRNAAGETNISFLFGGESDAHIPETRRPDGVETRVFRRISARSLLDATRAPLPAARVSAEPFVGRFVVIGATHADAHDEHMTPIGKLPGAVIAANAIAGAPAILSAVELSAFGKTLVALLLFAAFAALSLRFRASVASVVVSLCSLALLPVLGRLFAPSSALEVVFAAIAMLAMFAALESVLEIWRGWRDGLGWRVLLKPSKSPKEIA